MEHKFKIGDWIVVVANTTVGCNVVNGECYQIIRTWNEATRPYIKIDTTLHASEIYCDNCRPATKEEIEKVIGVKEFVLPSSWCLELTKESRPVVNKWVRELYGSSRWGDLDTNKYVVHPDPTTSSKDGNGLPEITFSQFKQYVLKERELSKEELLEKARKDYPVGTTYICPSSKHAFTVENPVQSWLNTKEIYGEMNKGCLYYNGKWAEIISTPEAKPLTVEVKELVIDKTYYCEGEIGSNHSYIFKALDDLEYCPYIIIHMNDYETDGDFSTDEGRLNLRVATQEESQWLKKCIELNKFIPKEEALKKEVKFEVGKWYKVGVKCSFSYFKYSSTEKVYSIVPYDRIHFFEWISNEKYISVKDYIANTDIKNSCIEVPLSEIQQYLPLNHPDKTPNEWWKTLKKGDVVRCIANPENKGNRTPGKEYIIYSDYDGFINYFDDSSCSVKFNEFELVRRANEIVEVPEYVEYEGVVYKVKDWTNHNYCKLIRHEVDPYPTPLEPFKHLVKPSTKEAYEAQQKGYVSPKLVKTTIDSEEYQEYIPNDFKQASDVSDWLQKKVNLNHLPEFIRCNVFIKETEEDIVQLPKFLLNKDYTNYFEKQLED